MTNPRNVRFISRISNKKFCVFLAVKGIAKEITNNYAIIEINGLSLQVQQLLNKYKIIILSNVYPMISTYTTRNHCYNLNMHKGSFIIFLRANMIEKNSSHILSFHRYIYIYSEQVHKLPENTKMPFIGFSHPSKHSNVCYANKRDI